MTNEFFERHRDMLMKAVEMTASRGYWSPFKEVPSPKVYGETAQKDGEAAFKARLNKKFEIDQPGAEGFVGAERISPDGREVLRVESSLRLQRLDVTPPNAPTA